MWDSVKRYAERTRASGYTLALVLPFLAIYEIGLPALRLTRDDFRARNGADAIIRSVLFPLGLQRAGAAGAFAWSIVSVLVLAACYLVWRARERAAFNRDIQDSQDGGGHARSPSGPSCPSLSESGRFEPRYVGWLFAESTGWAFLLFVASVLLFTDALSAPGPRAAAGGGGPSIAATPGNRSEGAWRYAAEIVLNSGAGVYEEFVFRVILVLVLALFFTKVVHLERTPGGVAAAFAAAVIFSLVHFGGGEGADPWGGPGFLRLFAFRAAAGLLFSLLFYFRSFGVAVAAHAFYDSMVTAARALA